VGPHITKLDRLSVYGNAKFHSDYEVECLTSSVGVRADTAVFGKGRYYYECKILTQGLMQIGWCTLATPFTSENGVGDDETSYAYDGMRVKKWNVQSSDFGE
jgi:Kip1 ubiquitination-promoting complex protein 1